MDLRLRRRGLLGFSLGMAVYALLIVALYPSFRHDSSLDSLTKGNEKLMALFGAAGSLTSPSGWMNANLYGNFLPLIALLMTIGYGASAVAGQNEDGALGGFASLPISRDRLLAGKVAALAIHALPVPVVCLVVTLVGRGFELHLDSGPLLAVTVTASLMAFDFGLIALAVGSWTGSRGTALAVATVLAAGSYLISSMAAVISGIHAVRFLSPVYWAVGAGQITQGTTAVQVALLVGLGGLLGVVSWIGFKRLDIA